MWKKSFIFLLVLAVAVSSVCAYPAWVYGKAAEKEVEPLEVPTLEEVAEPGKPKKSSKQEKTLPAEESKVSLQSVKASVNESVTDKEVAKELSRQLDAINDGIEVMEKAYNAEVKAHEQTEAEYNALADAYANDVGKPYKPFKVTYTVTPFVTYAPKTQAWGVGTQLSASLKNVSLMVGASYPNVTDLGKNFDNVVVTAGVGFSF